MNTPLNTDHQERLNKAFLDGALILLSIGQQRWTTKLTPELIQQTYQADIASAQTQLASLEADLSKDHSAESDKLRRRLDELAKNLEASKSLPENFKLGRVFLLPEERLKAINQIENKARGYLDRCSFEFGGESRAKFRFVNKKLVMETLIDLGDFRDKYFAAVDSLITDFEKLKADMKDKYPLQWPLLEQFYPQQVAIRDKYYFTFEARAMAFPKTLDGLDLEDLRRRDVTDKEYRAKAERVLAEQREMAARQAKSFIEEALKSVRGKVVDVFQGLLKKIEDGKEITTLNVNRLRQVFDDVEKMDFLNDHAFREQLKAVRKQLDATRTFKDNTSAVKALGEALAGTVAFVGKTTDADAAAASRNYFQRSLSI